MTGVHVTEVANFTVFTVNIATYSGFSIHDRTLLHSKSQYTTVKHSQQLFEHTYMSDLYGTVVWFP
jgi:hypothetical protein